MKKRFLAVFLALALCVGLAPSTAFAAEGDFVIIVVFGNKYLMEYNGPGGDVVIPDGIYGICDGAFKDCVSMTSVTIPDSVVYIGSYSGPGAFEGCTGLTSVIIPDSVVFLGPGTFRSCTNLTSVTLPTNCDQWGFGMFSDTNLKDIYYAGSEFQLCNSFIYGDMEVGESCDLDHWLWEVCYDGSKPDVTVHFGKSTIDPLAAFTDVKSNGFYLDAVKWAVNTGVTKGTTDTTFSPDQNCTHGQILTFLWRAAGSPASNVTLPFETTGAEYYLGAAKWAYEKGMIGADFNPKADCTRANAVSYIWQAFDKPASEYIGEYDGRFTDVPASAPYAGAVVWALTMDITTGTSATTFSPNKICTRSEIITFLYRAPVKSLYSRPSILFI